MAPRRVEAVSNVFRTKLRDLLAKDKDIYREALDAIDAIRENPRDSGVGDQKGYRIARFGRVVIHYQFHSAQNQIRFDDFAVVPDFW